jgi:hypothetical protein
MRMFVSGFTCGCAYVSEHTCMYMRVYVCMFDDLYMYWIHIVCELSFTWYSEENPSTRNHVGRTLVSSVK